MVYLQSFTMPTDSQEVDFLVWDKRANMTCFSSRYPFGLFKGRELPELFFNDVTIFYGNNGSGKSTILNVIAEKLGLNRTTPYNRSAFFDDYVNLSDYVLEKAIPKGSSIITSDGIFERVLDIRRVNEGIDDRREALVREYIEEKTSEAPNLLRGLDDFDRWKRANEMRSPNRSQSSFLRKNLVRNLEERSNGESALAYFVDSIKEGCLYLLDEPENSLSAANQIQLKYFIEDSVRSFGCQFIISTHSPFLLATEHATVYDIDTSPVREREWYELESVRAYFKFFKENEWRFNV